MAACIGLAATNPRRVPRPVLRQLVTRLGRPVLQVRGKKRHVLVDTQGLLMHALVQAADVQDRDGGVVVMATLFGLYPFLLKLYADGGYQGPQF